MQLNIIVYFINKLYLSIDLINSRFLGLSCLSENCSIFW